MAIQSPKLTLSTAARTEIERLAAQIHDFKPVAAIVWAFDGWFETPDGRTGTLPDGWEVGFHDARKIPPEWIIEIDGISFVLEGARIWELDGRQLDFDGRKFRVVDIAI